MDKDWQESVCEKLADGMTFREIGTMKNMPSVREIRRALWNDEKFQRCVHAAMKVTQIENYSELVPLADGATADDVGIVKLQIQTRQWCMERLARDTFHTRNVVENIDTDAKKIAAAKMAGELIERRAVSLAESGRHKGITESHTDDAIDVSPIPIGHRQPDK